MDEVKLADFQPASFVDKGKILSEGQQHLMNLLTQRIKENRPITQEDIVACYFKIASKDGEKIRVRFGLGTHYFQCDFLDKNSSTAKQRANRWFITNLGACIIKGKLLVIPVIDIEQRQIQ